MTETNLPATLWRQDAVCPGMRGSSVTRTQSSVPFERFHFDGLLSLRCMLARRDGRRRANLVASTEGSGGGGYHAQTRCAQMRWRLLCLHASIAIPSLGALRPCSGRFEEMASRHRDPRNLRSLHGRNSRRTHAQPFRSQAPRPLPLPLPGPRPPRPPRSPPRPP